MAKEYISSLSVLDDDRVDIKLLTNLPDYLTISLCLEQHVLTCLEQPQDKSRHTASQDSSRRDGSMLLWCVAAYVYVAMLAAMNAISCAAY